MWPTQKDLPESFIAFRPLLVFPHFHCISIYSMCFYTSWWAIFKLSGIKWDKKNKREERGWSLLPALLEVTSSVLFSVMSRGVCPQGAVETGEGAQRTPHPLMLPPRTQTLPFQVLNSRPMTQIHFNAGFPNFCQLSQLKNRVAWLNGSNSPPVCDLYLVKLFPPFRGREDQDPFAF